MTGHILNVRQAVLPGCDTVLITNMGKTGDFIVLKRREPETMDRLIEECIRDMKLQVGLDDVRIFSAWDEVSGASAYTMDRYFRNGTLCCSISSSVVRSMLLARKSQLVRQMNEVLRNASGPGMSQGRTIEIKNLILR